MKGFILGIIFALICLAGGLYLYFAGGYVPVETSAQAMPFEKKLAHMALEARAEKLGPKTVPIQADDAAYVAAASLYKDNCAVCHGLPGQPETPIARGEYPRPPQLFRGRGVTDDSPGETYWKVANGIRLTGMPAFKPSFNETQLWQVTLLLKDANKLPAAAQQALGGTVQMKGDTGGEHKHDHEHDH